MRFHGKIIQLGGIGSVCTHPDFQRQGIATKLLQKAIDELKKARCDIAYLCTDVSKLGKLYGQVGFTQLNRKHKFTGHSGKQYLEWDGMIAPIKSHEVFDEVLNSTEPFDLQGTNW